MLLGEFLAFCDSNDNICVYGAGVYGRAVMVYLEEQKYEACFVETNPVKKCIMGKDVIALQEVKRENCAFIVAVGTKYREEILQKLTEFGYDNIYIITSELMTEIRRETKYDVDIHNESKFSRNVNVLLYHRVADLQNDFWGISVSPKDFEEHVKYAKDNYQILRFEDDWNDVKEKSLVFTFDDGYKDNYIWALPILEKYKVPATFFVSTGNIGMHREFWWDRLARIFLCADKSPETIYVNGVQLSLRGRNLYANDLVKIHGLLKAMDTQLRDRILDELENNFCPCIQARNEDFMITEDELIYMDASSVVTIGGHSVSHPALGKLPLEIQEVEIKNSKKVIENILGHDVEVFSYPFGSRDDFNQCTVDLVEKAGYKKAAANYQGLADGLCDKYRVPRNKIYPGNGNMFAKQIKGIWKMLCED